MRLLSAFPISRKRRLTALDDARARKKDLEASLNDIAAGALVKANLLCVERYGPAEGQQLDDGSATEQQTASGRWGPNDQQDAEARLGNTIQSADVPSDDQSVSSRRPPLRSKAELSQLKAQLDGAKRNVAACERNLISERHANPTLPQM